MKNLLSENMLRFGTKNLSESTKKKLVFESIMQTIKEHGLTDVIRKQLTEATVKVDSPSKGYIDVTVPVDSATLGKASKILGSLMTAFGGMGTDDAKAKAAIYSISSPALYYAVLYKVQTSANLRAEYGKNFKLIGEFLSEDMSFAAGTTTNSSRTTQSPGAAYQQVTGAQAQYKAYEKHLRQFNLDEYIKSESMSDR
jgi:hypothetical protein